MNKNLFLDAGGVILNEQQFEAKSAEIITELISKYKKYTLEDYKNDAEEAVCRYVPRVYDYILYKNIKNIELFSILRNQYKASINSNENFELTDGIVMFLQTFSQHYKIGILGQYGENFKEFLNTNGLLKYFTYSETNDNYNITKPDPRYFEAILKTCKCNPQESVMIGDRIDKDIIPAKMIGMKTVRIKTGLHINQEARIPVEIADYTVNSLNEISVEMIEKL